MRFLVVTAIVVLCRFAHAQVLIEFGPETPGAVEAGAPAVKDALKLTKDPENKWEALFAFQQIALDRPAAIHDCYVSLAELRVDQLTIAKVFWDRAAARGGARPKWCTGDLANQLAKALRDHKYVEVTLAVTPGDAVVMWNKTVAVKGAASLWVLCGPSCDPGALDARDTPFEVSAPGYAGWHGSVVLKPHGVRLEVQLHPEPPATDVTDAGVVAAPVPDAGVPPPQTFVPAKHDPDPDPDDRPRVHRFPLKKLALGLAIGAAATAAVSVYLTHYESNKGSVVYKSDPTFAESNNLYTSFGVAAIVSSAVSLAGFVAYFVLPEAPAVTLAPQNGGVTVGVGGTFGGPR